MDIHSGVENNIGDRPAPALGRKVEHVLIDNPSCFHPSSPIRLPQP